MDYEIAKRRFNECEILCAPLMRPVSEFCAGPYHLPDKRSIRRELRRLGCNNLDLTAPEEHSLINCRFYYDYQRYDCIISILRPSNVIPLTDDSTVASRTFFVSSGMGAISSFILSLYSYNDFSMKYSPDIYFETYKLLGLFDKSCGTWVHYLDSIQIKPSQTLSTILALTNPSIIILDTTCWSYNESLLHIQQILEHGHICIAVRSHTKLDMLGTEYSKLGSITYYLLKPSDRETVNLLKNVMTHHMEMIGHFGIWAAPEAIPMFWSSDDYKIAAEVRISALREANSFAAQILQNQTSNMVILPEHKLFILLKLSSESKMKETDLRSKLKEHVISKQLEGAPVRMATGFGFDDIVVDLYFDNCTGTNMIRVAFGDSSPEEIKHTVKYMQEFIHDIQN